MRLTIRAKPGSRHPSITIAGDVIVIAVRERAVDGAANEAVCRSIAAWLDLAPRHVRIEHGESARVKIVSVDGIDDAAFGAARDRLR